MLPAVRPPSRSHYGISFDRARARLLLYGGNGGGTLNDTWSWDAAVPVVLRIGAPGSEAHLGVAVN
ncbi:MAG: hypothetical protein ABI972_10095 [Acidobacteriota bacterium]